MRNKTDTDRKWHLTYHRNCCVHRTQKLKFRRSCNLAKLQTWDGREDRWTHSGGFKWFYLIFFCCFTSQVRKKMTRLSHIDRHKWMKILKSTLNIQYESNWSRFVVFLSPCFLISSCSDQTLCCHTWSSGQSAWTPGSEGKIHKDARVKSDRLTLEPDCSLVIKTVTAEDDGRYSCRHFRSGERHGEDTDYDLTVVTGECYIITFTAQTDLLEQNTET